MEKRFLGSSKAKLWTYLVIFGLLIVGALVVNFAIVNPELAEGGVSTFMGLPSWAFPVIAAVVGAIIYWLGLKVETDWPEFLGALLISGAILAAEIMIGWDKFELGGIAAIPFIIPPAVLVVLFGIGMVKSR